MKINIGIEKECLVFDQEMQPVDIDVANLPDDLTVDFANHQLEIVGKINNETHCTDVYLNKLLSHPYFIGKRIWPLSIPLDENENVKHELVDGNYRNYLADKYGIEKMLYSGIHFNYSNELLTTELDYFNLMKKIYVYMPIIMQFTSYTPVLHKEQKGLEPVGKNFGFENSISLRNSREYGFSNDENVVLNYDSLDSFKQSKLDIITKGDIMDEREIYSKIRLKYAGSHYLELRFIDLNPFIPSGISSEQLIFITEVLSYLSKTDVSFKQDIIDSNIELVSLEGNNKQLQLDIDDRLRSIKDHTLYLFDQIITNCENESKKNILNELKWKYQNQLTDFDLMKKQLSDITLMEFGLENIHVKEVFQPIYPDLDMELSTKLVMQAALNKGFEVQVESKSQNILKISNGEKSEYVIQATKTNLDGYATVLLMNDKHMTKKILEQNNIPVPKGILVKKDEPFNLDIIGLVVVKPLDTNFGLGISIVDSEDKNSLNEAVKTAFSYSDEIIIERFISGEEYRLLVIGDEVVSIVTRKNANVTGDCQKSIEQLIEEKNSSSLRGIGYKRPLEKIIIDDDLIRVLKNQGYDLSTQLDCGQTALLRDTSNVSQGGETYEVSNQIPDKYKQYAVQAAKALGAKICGVDMIIDLHTGDCAIIEANFNPALHMHMYPYSGRGVDAASKVVDLLFKQ